jgi:hypothetical protein
LHTLCKYYLDYFTDKGFFFFFLRQGLSVKQICLPSTCSVEQAGLEFRSACLFLLRTGIKGCANMLGVLDLFKA